MRKSRKQQKNDRRRIVPITAKTINQKDYIRDIVENDVIFCTGPSGSGKSYIAAGIAANHIYRDEVEQIIVTRPLVCAGKDIGSLPITPGMQAEINIKTGKRSVFNYLLSPVLKTWHAAFRER